MDNLLTRPSRTKIADQLKVGGKENAYREMLEVIKRTELEPTD